MQPFTYARAASLDEAFHLAGQPGAAVMAGGTTMVDLMRGDLTAPASIVDIGHLDELASFDTSGPVLRFGALARMADVAEDATLLHDYPALAESLQLAASQQLRNAATVGGNLLQRTRCVYFRNGTSACNKRVPGSGCSALDGVTREMALFATSDRCIAVYPGDWGNALAAFDTSVEVRSAGGTRTIPFGELHVAYGDDPAAETTLRPGEIITAILVQATPAGRRSTYLKVRDRQSYAYAVVSATVALQMDGGVVREARVSLGGVAGKPWRSHAAEAALMGVELTEETAIAAGHAGFADAKPLAGNAFKIELGARAVARAALVASKRI
ncbi:MAG: xanthine dehydrogenase family protein subunit M [Gemmatimonadaceae bacterium]|nr:xanthine dehydrogenase family protein subunit M [Acetobacteraceae bacterium]